MAEGALGPYSFTVGLQHSHGHPELILFGLPSAVTHQILSTAAEAIRCGSPIDLTQPTDELVEGYPCVFVKVLESEYQEHVGYARWYYQGNGFGLYQVVWSDRQGRFPWHPGASQAFRANQPVMGSPPPGH